MSRRDAPRIALIVNPASGVGRAAIIAGAVAERLRIGAHVTVRSGATAEESAQLVRSCVGSFDALVVLGGDGIVNIAVQSLATTETPLGIIAAGTGNDSAESLGLPVDPMGAADAVLDALHTGASHRIDLGRTDSGRWWFTVLCAGFDSAVNQRANAMRWPHGRRRYDLAILAETVRLRARDFRVELDGHDLHLPATLVAVGNTPQYGGGKRMTPGASLTDGRFAVTVVGEVGRIALARMAPRLPRAGHLGHPAVSTYAATTVRLDAPGTVAYADGECMGTLPISTTCIPQALSILVPDRLATAALSR